MNLNKPVPSDIPKNPVPPKPKGFKERVEWERKYGKPTSAPTKIVTWTFTLAFAALTLLCSVMLGAKMVSTILETF